VKASVSSPLSKYCSFNTRICRPVGLTPEECQRVCSYAIERIGFGYDYRNLFGLMRCLIPLPLQHFWRRPKSELSSEVPTQIICSTLIAQAFDLVRYPVLPEITQLESALVQRDVLQIRDSSLCTPRDFDISPYFQVVKPGLMDNFNYRLMNWIDLPRTAFSEVKEEPTEHPHRCIGIGRTETRSLLERCFQFGDRDDQDPDARDPCYRRRTFAKAGSSPFSVHDMPGSSRK
jgi:hypothetical protein